MTTVLLPAPFQGVYPVIPTPFHPDGSVDTGSAERLASSLVDERVDGIVVLGGLGEGAKLSVREQDLLLGLTVRASAGRIPVIAGLHASEGASAELRAGGLAAQGAPGLLVTPVGGADLDRKEQFMRLSIAVDLPLVLQYYPDVSGVTLSMAFLVQLAAETPQLVAIKLEDRPASDKIGALRAAGIRTRIFGGLGALYLLEELGRGADGVMSGFSRPDILVRIWEAFRGGDLASARDLFYKACPLMRLEFQPGTGLALQKEAFRLIGLLASSRVREPGIQMDPVLAQELSDVLNWLSTSKALDRGGECCLEACTAFPNMQSRSSKPTSCCKPAESSCSRSCVLQPMRGNLK